MLPFAVITSIYIYTIVCFEADLVCSSHSPLTEQSFVLLL
jgi:hypothetical protein